MANISDIQNILEKAKNGQYISINCQKNASNFDATVVQLGTDKVQAVKVEDWTEGWPADPEPELGPLCFTAEQAGSTVTLDSLAEGAPIADFYPNMNLQYSKDGNTWIAIDFTKTPTENTITLANVGDKVYFKAITENPVDEWDYGNSNPPCTWNMSGRIAASGNIQSLLDSTYQRTDVLSYCYASMFEGCRSLTQAPELPATTLAEACYDSMFEGCTSLTQAPSVLPATTLADYCYQSMFYNCTSLTQAPALPATTLANSCYGGMFSECTSLTQAPSVLPATTLAESCYDNMFSNCTSLTQAPALPATTLADSCYQDMFNDCVEFSEVHMKASMEGVYNPDTHGDTAKTVIYDL